MWDLLDKASKNFELHFVHVYSHLDVPSKPSSVDAAKNEEPYAHLIRINDEVDQLLKRDDRETMPTVFDFPLTSNEITKKLGKRVQADYEKRVADRKTYWNKGAVSRRAKGTSDMEKLKENCKKLKINIEDFNHLTLQQIMDYVQPRYDELMKKREEEKEKKRLEDINKKEEKRLQDKKKKEEERQQANKKKDKSNNNQKQQQQQQKQQVKNKNAKTSTKNITPLKKVKAATAGKKKTTAVSDNQQQQKENKLVENKQPPKDPLEIVYEIIKKLPTRLQFTDCKPCTIKKYFTRRQLPLFYARAGVLWIHEGLLHDKFTQCRFCKKDLCQNRGENPLRHFLCCSELKETRKDLFSKGKCDFYTVNEGTTVDVDTPLTTTTKQIPWKYKCMQLVFDQKYENLFLNYYTAAVAILTKQKQEKEKTDDNNSSNTSSNKTKK